MQAQKKKQKRKRPNKSTKTDKFVPESKLGLPLRKNKYEVGGQDNKHESDKELSIVNWT